MVLDLKFWMIILRSDLEYKHLWRHTRCFRISNQILQPQSAHKTPRIKGLISHCATRFSFVVENQRDAFQRSVTLENCLLLYCTIEGTCTSKIGFDNFPFHSLLSTRDICGVVFSGLKCLPINHPLEIAEVKYQNVNCTHLYETYD